MKFYYDSFMDPKNEYPKIQIECMSIGDKSLSTLFFIPDILKNAFYI
jgi:hypothetical protein